MKGHSKTKVLRDNTNVPDTSSEDIRSFKRSLKQLQALQSSILEVIPHAVVGLKDRTIFFANHAVEKVFGWKPDEIIGKKTRLFYRNDEDYEEICRRVYPLLEKQRTHTENIICVRKDGREIACRISVSVIGKKLAGKGIVVMYEDITKYRNAEHGLLESEQRYKTVFENTGTAMIIIEQDASISMANAEVEKISGYSREEIEGKMKVIDFVVKEDLDQMIYYHNLRRNDPEAAPRNYEYRMTGKQGDIKQIFTTVAMIPGTQKSIASIIDITERNRTEKKLQESERKYRELVQNANSIILRWNSNGEITFLNEFGQAFFGYSEQDILGRHVVGTIVPETDSTGSNLRPLMDYISADPKVFKQNINENMRRDGSRVWVSWTNKAVFDQQGQIQEVFSIGTDITERTRAEEELKKYREHLEELVRERTQQLELSNKELEQSNTKLRELDRLKSMFIASMSHELRTPLNSVIGFSCILLDEWLGPLNAEQKENLSSVLRSGKHLLALINDVIDVSKIEAGTVESHPEDFDLKDVLGEAAGLFAKEIAGKGLAAEVVSASLKMHADRRRLLQCVANLVNNAVKFTDKGSIRVQTRLITDSGSRIFDLNKESELSAICSPQSAIEISVTDTGIGIKEEDMAKLFSPFVRLDTPLRAKVLGTGLGLYLTKKLVTEILHGDITAQSTCQEGSVFTIRIPAILSGQKNAL